MIFLDAEKCCTCLIANIFFQECYTTYTEECKPSYNYEKKCHKVPKQNCSYKKVPKCHDVPQEHCSKYTVPKCHKVPEKKCRYYTVPKCHKVPEQYCTKEYKQRCHQYDVDVPYQATEYECIWPKDRYHDDHAC